MSIIRSYSLWSWVYGSKHSDQKVKSQVKLQEDIPGSLSVGLRIGTHKGLPDIKNLHGLVYQHFVL